MNMDRVSLISIMTKVYFIKDYVNKVRGSFLDENLELEDIDNILRYLDEAIKLYEDRV